MSKRVALTISKSNNATAVSSSGVASSNNWTHPALPSTRPSLAGGDGAGKPEGGQGREDVVSATERPIKPTSSLVAPSVGKPHQQQPQSRRMEQNWSNQQTNISSMDGSGGVQAKDANLLQQGSSYPARQPIGDVQPQGSPEEHTAGPPVAPTTGHQQSRHQEQRATMPLPPYVPLKSEESGVNVQTTHGAASMEEVHKTLEVTAGIQQQQGVSRSECAHKLRARAATVLQQSTQVKGVRSGETVQQVDGLQQHRSLQQDVMLLQKVRGQQQQVRPRTEPQTKPSRESKHNECHLTSDVQLVSALENQMSLHADGSFMSEQQQQQLSARRQQQQPSVQQRQQQQQQQQQQGNMQHEMVESFDSDSSHSADDHWAGDESGAEQSTAGSEARSYAGEQSGLSGISDDGGFSGVDELSVSSARSGQNGTRRVTFAAKEINGNWKPAEKLNRVKAEQAERLRQPHEVAKRQEQQRRVESPRQQPTAAAAAAAAVDQPVPSGATSLRTTFPTAGAAVQQPSTQRTAEAVSDVDVDAVKVKTEPAVAEAEENDALLYAAMRTKQPLSTASLDRMQILIDARHAVVDTLLGKKTLWTPESKKERRRLIRVQEFLTLEVRELEKWDKLMRRYRRNENCTTFAPERRSNKDGSHRAAGKAQQHAVAAEQVSAELSSSSSDGSSSGASSEPRRSRAPSDRFDLPNEGGGRGKQQHTSTVQRQPERRRVKRVQSEVKAVNGPAVRVGPWEHYPIRAGDENLYLEPSNMATGVYNHKWPPGRQFMKLIRIPNYSTTTEKGKRRRPAKQVRRMFESKDMNNHPQLNGNNVITWLNELCHAMARHDTSPYAVATELERGFNMKTDISENFLMLVKSRRNQPHMKLVDSQDFEGAILWLDALMRCLVDEYGPEVSQVGSMCMQTASTLRLKTRTLAGVRTLWMETMDAFSDLAPEDATFELMSFVYSDALIRNPYVDHTGAHKPGDLMDQYQVEWRAAEQQLRHRADNPLRAPEEGAATKAERFHYQNEMVREISRMARLSNKDHSEFPDPSEAKANRPIPWQRGQQQHLYRHGWTQDYRRSGGHQEQQGGSW